MVNGESLLVGAISASGAQAIGQSIQITGSTPVRLTIRAARSCSIHFVPRHNGKPIAGAMIILVPENASSNVPLFMRESDSDGRLHSGISSLENTKFSELKTIGTWNGLIQPS